MTIELPARRRRAPRTDVERRRRQLPISWPRVQLAGTTADLFEFDDAVDMIIARAHGGPGTLGVVSVNLDHLHHFGSGRYSARVLRQSLLRQSQQRQVQWLALLDGAPLVTMASELTGRPWPRLAGSDLIEPLLDRAETERLRVGFLGGAGETLAALRGVLASRWPQIALSGCWSPSRSELADPAANARLVAMIAEAGVDLLVVCLGKPRQEQWIAEHAVDAGVGVCLAFGAVADFLAGRVERAPQRASRLGLEWAWRLAKEPRRLARRYLVQGPPAYRALHRDSYVMASTSYFAEPATTPHPSLPLPSLDHAFTERGPVDVAVLVVTYNSQADLPTLLASLRWEVRDQSLRVIVVDNGSTDGTLALLSEHPDVLVVQSGANLGYAGGINVGRRHTGTADAVLVINPDVVIEPGALRTLRERLLHDHVGVAVPRLLDVDGLVYPSQRREPAVLGAVGDALFGDSLSGRPGWLSEIVWSSRSYRYAHPVEWASGAALLISRETEVELGDWDERYFLYSEEVDYLRRVRESGREIWYEPQATMQHRRGGSGSSDQLEALLAVNRVRYADRSLGPLAAAAFRSAVVVGSLLRFGQSRHRTALRYLVDRRRWPELPHAEERP